MRRFPHGGEVLGASPAHPLLAPVLRPEPVLSRQRALLDLQAIQRIPGLAGYWPADPAYLFEDSGATTPASLNGVVGCWTSVGPAAIQATTAVKPYLLKTSQSGIYWLDSNTSTSALTATLGNLGSACTVAKAGAEGVTFTEGVTISSTYNIAPAYGFNGDVAIFNRALTASEKALLTRYMARGVPLLGANLITNSDFSNGLTEWLEAPALSGWSVVDGKATHTAGSYSSLYSTTAVTGVATGQVYLLVFDVTAIAGGVLYSYVRGTSGSYIVLPARRHVKAITAGSANRAIQLEPTTDTAVAIDYATLQAIL